MPQFHIDPLRALSTHLLFGIVDIDGRFVFVSDRLRSATGYDSDELLGTPFTTILKVDAAASRKKPVLTVIESGAPLLNVLTALTPKSNHSLPVRYDAYPLTDDAGRTAGAIVWIMLQSLPRGDVLSHQGDPVPELVGRAPSMLALKSELLRVAADSEVTVLVEGESGTGKELVARAIHQHSSREAEPFVVVNLAGLSPELIESELFGHVRGAFTGAIADRIGPFERAHRGTIFLDEIGELPRELQAKLLRVVQERRVQRVGSHVEAPFDARLIAATNRNLWQEVKERRFREDLYYRLRVFELRIPPLRDRGAEEIALLASHFLERLSERRGRPVPGIAEDVLARLAAHSWPGNVRELENVVERALVAAEGGVITARDLPQLAGGPSQRQGAGRGNRVTPERIAWALKRHGYNKTHAAAALGISRYRLRREVVKHHVPDRPPRDVNDG